MKRVVAGVEWVILVVLVVGCAKGWGTGKADANQGPPVDAISTIDGPTQADGPVAIDADTPPTPDASPSDAQLPDAGSLDPDLELPDPSGDVCTTPGSLSECGLIEVCRFYDIETGRCESCDECGNLGAYCTASSQCDILFMCYQNACTNFCHLGTYECGPIDDCLDVGHATMGVCRP